jgi:ATP-dependent RNA helicase DeaD
MDLMDRKILDLVGVDWFILDEADEMLDMGFFEDVEVIMNALKTGRGTPPAGETPDKAVPGVLPFRVALFSATMPDAILRVVKKHIGEAEILEDTAPDEGASGSALLIDQFYMILKREDRLEALRRVIDGTENFYGLIFCATKLETDELARRLVENGYPAEAIHGDLSQEARERTLRRFRSKQTTIMVATDVAARGLDIERLTHVVNWDLPHDRETYVHRIGRTGRAGRKGKAVTLTLPSDRGRISQLSRSRERILGSGIRWMKVPSVKSVMKALRTRIVSEVLAGLPEAQTEAPAPLSAVPLTATEKTTALATETEGPVTADGALAGDAAQGAAVIATDDEAGTTGPETASPFLTKVCRSLIERLGAEIALEALITVHYGEALDPSRYGPVTEFAEALPQRPSRAGGSRGGFFPAKEWSPAGPGRKRGHFGEEGLSNTTRVYVGLGWQHGASARDVAALLTRAGGVPGRMVDAIEMKDYCAFATLPEDAARRACLFSRGGRDIPPIRLAKAPGR